MKKKPVNAKTKIAIAAIAVLAVLVIIAFSGSGTPHTNSHTTPSGSLIDCGTIYPVSESALYNVDPKIVARDALKCFKEAFSACSPASLEVVAFGIEGQRISDNSTIEKTADGKCEIVITRRASGNIDGSPSNPEVVEQVTCTGLDSGWLGDSLSARNCFSGSDRIGSRSIYPFE